MSDNAPRWPGSDGSAGLDFSRGRTATDQPLNLYRDGSSLPSVNGRNGSHDGTNGATPEGEHAEQGPSSPVTPGRPEGAPSANETMAKSTVAPVGSDLERSQQSAAEWASKPLHGDAEPKPSRALTSDEPDTAAPGATAAGAGAGVAAGAAGAAAGSAVTRPRLARPRTTPVVTPGGSARRSGARRTRKARLRLTRLDPWSVMKTTFLFSIAFGVMLMVIAWVLWTVLQGSGALDAVNKFINTLVGSEGEVPFKIEDVLNGPRVLGFAAVLAAIDVVILTAVSTLFAFLYNLAATVIGGLEVTLAED